VSLYIPKNLESKPKLLDAYKKASLSGKNPYYHAGLGKIFILSKEANKALEIT